MKFLRLITIGKKQIFLECEILSFGYWPKLEAIFQGCGLHLRHVLNFEKHVFLAKIDQITFLDTPNKNLFVVKGFLLSRTNSAAKYEGLLFDKDTEKIYVSANFLLGCKKFNNTFKKHLITSHFKGIFKCLMNTKKY